MARILALPLAAVVLLLALVAAQPVRDYRESQTTSRSVGIALGVQSLVGVLQDERGVASLVLGGNESFTNELTRVRAAVDSQRRELAALVAGSGDVEARVRGALRSLDGLGPVRSATDSGAAARQATFTFYTDRIAGLTQLDLGLSEVGDTELAAGVAVLTALQDAAEATAQERAFLSGVFSAGGFRRGEFVTFAEMRAAKANAWKRYFAVAGTQETASARYLLDTGAGRVVDYFEGVAVLAADGRPVVVNPQSWWSAHTTVLDDMGTLREHVGSTIRLRAFELQREATLRLGGLLVVVLLCVGGSIYLAVLASLAVSRPLADLAAEAETVADERLPAAMLRLRAFDPGSGSAEPAPPRPAPVAAPRRASAEIRSVVSALNHLQEAAYRLAVEQAMQRRATLEALTNLGRRNQNLVRKQLRFISNLEKEEMDPTGLANLFELDHLATRMRRNASSLLVLTGAQSPGQWTTPAPIADVMRAAVSEVEDYRRVALRRVDETLVSGAVIGSLSHLLSELIENGLRFSPPDCEVEVVGRQLGDDYLIAVVDQGIGMSAEDLEDANGRLRGEGDFMVTPSRFLGHYVVGRLAEQAGVRVELLPSPVTGVTARIHIPDALLVRPGQIESGQVVSATDHGRGAREAPRSVPVTVTATVTGPVDLTAVRERHEEAAAAARQVPAASGAHATPPAGDRYSDDRVVVDIQDDAAAPAAAHAAAPMTVPARDAGTGPIADPAAKPAVQPAGRAVPTVRTDPAAAHPPSSIFNVPATTAPALPTPTSPTAPALSPVPPSPAQPVPAVMQAPTSPPAPAAARRAPEQGAPVPPSSPLPPSSVLRRSAVARQDSIPGVPGVPVESAVPPVVPPVVPPAVAPGVGASGRASDLRTRNGLRVRVPGSTRATPVPGVPGSGGSRSYPVAPPAGPPVLQGPIEESAPGRLGNRFSALRSGMQRGFEDTTPDAPEGGDAMPVVPKHHRVAGTQTEERS